MRAKTLKAALGCLGLAVCAACASGRTTPIGKATTLSTVVPPANTAAPPSPKAADVEAPPAPAAEPTVLTEDQRRRDGELRTRAMPVVDAMSNVDPVFSRDKKRVLFRSNRDGVWQAYMGDVAHPAAAPKRLTTGDDRVTFASLTADEKYVVYVRDQRADENFQIFRMRLDGSEATNLTPDKKLHRDVPFLPKLRPTEMVYSARDNAAVSTPVFVQSIGDGQARIAYTDPQPGTVVDVAPDGSHALFLRHRSPSDQSLLRVDLDSGTATRIFPLSERKTVRINAAKYSTDGRRVFVATDDGTDSSFLVRIEPGTGVVSGRYREEAMATARIADVVVAPRGDKVAVFVDAGNRSEARILDDTLKVSATLKTPLGSLEAGEFSDDGKSLSVAVSTADRPWDILDADVTTGVAKPLRADVQARALPKVDASIASVRSFDDLTVPVNVYLPAARSGARTAMPTIVSLPAGVASSAKLAFSPTTAFFVSLGYAVVEPNVRGSAGFGRAYELADNKEKRGNALRDLEAVNQWVRAQPWSDKNRIAIMGESYGGYLTLLALGRQPNLWWAGVDQIGVSDLRTFLRSTTQTVRALLVDEFGDLDRDASILAELSPKTHVSAIVAPLFVYQGVNDPRVLRSEADAIVNTLRARNVPVEYMLAANEGHSIDHRDTKLELLSRAARFFEEHSPRASASGPIAAR